jgi:hypothetical protein
MEQKTLTLPKREDTKVKEREATLAKRTPVSGNRDILTVEGMEDGWHYRWVLDLGNRTKKFEKAGYEFVEHEVVVGDARAGVAEGLGSIVEALSGNGNQKLVLMRIKEEFYKEDQESKERELQALEAGMGKEISGTYGNIGIERK